MVTYETLKESFEDEILGCYNSFGIAAYIEHDGIAECAVYIPDVFTDENEAILLVEKCNRLALDPEHLADVVYDSL